ncbi:MAG: ABC transporter permease, partial [Collinsella intestinalis]
MQLYLKLALGNVRRGARDYSVYFATLGFAACLLYSFVASTDHLRAMGLSPEQLGVLGSAGDILQAFSVFTVLVFLFLVRYANRFRCAGASAVASTSCGHGARCGIGRARGRDGARGAGALACVCGGAALSPAFGAVAASCSTPWRLAFFSPDSAAWTAGCFAVVFAVNAVDGARDIARRPLIELMSAERAPERMRLGGRVVRGGQAVLAAVLLAVVWGSCVFQPVYFIAFIIPMGFAACFATSLVARLGVAAWGERARERSERYWDGLTGFTVRQVEARVSSTSMALACVCVLVAVAVCMMVAGFVFSIGLRTPEMVSAGIAASMAPIGYIGIFYGAVFLLSAVAVLALQQLSGAVDARRAYGVLGQLGCDRALMRASVRRQLALYFAAPLAGALVHDVFG